MRYIKVKEKIGTGILFCKEKRLVLEPTEDLEELYQKLKEGIRKADIIAVKNPMGKRNVEQCLNIFIKKYRPLISSVDISYEKPCITQIKLKTREKDKTGDYLDIQDEYDADYYLNDCGGYATFERFHGLMLDTRLAGMMYLVEPKKGDSILDIGCGRGELTYMLSKYASKTVGIDYSESAIEIARKHFGRYQTEQNLQYLCADVMDLNPEEKYNKIIMADVYEHIQAEAMECLLRKLTVLLREDGVLYIHTAPNLDYYEKVYTKHVLMENFSGGFLPLNPRSYYEEHMHINEQRPVTLKNTLQRHFLCAYAWSGNIETEEQLMDITKQQTDNEIYAVAGRHLHTTDLLRRISNDKLERETVAVQITCKEDCVRSDGRNLLIIPVKIENMGQGILKSQNPYPVYVSYHILTEKGDIVIYDGMRSDLSAAVLPGTDIEVFLKVNVQELEEGIYWIEPDLVQEWWMWFHEAGKSKTRIKLIRI